MSTGILGGGLTGLSLGNFIEDDFLILEKDNECGGLCRSLQEEGYTFDSGGHIIFSRDEEVMRFMVNLLGDNAARIRRNTKIFYKGRYVKYPFENGLCDLPLEDNYGCLLHFVQNYIERIRGMSPPANFKEWIYYNFGSGIAEKYMIPYNQKIWNYDLEKMSLDWVADRVPQPPLEDVIKASLGLESEGYTHQLYFYYPLRGGIQSMIRGLEKSVENNIIREFEIKSVKQEDGKWVVSDGKQEHLFERLVSTIPIQHLISCLDDVPSNVLDAVSSLQYNSLMVIMMGVSQSKLNDFSWVYLPRMEDGPVNRVCFPSNYSPHVAPSGKSAVTAEITFNQGDEVDKMSDEEIADQVIGDLDRNQILNRNDVCFTMVRRSKYAYIVYDLDYQRNISTVKEFINEKGIKLCGRFSEFEYLNMDACVKKAMNMAKELNNS